ncbi:hypothetical protein [Scytonema sp. NUACC26]|uniref:hypothetical protein n=1 Tax=Scytonema sp. NUACC26 TaxID=3140176 RepID=UPI0034DBC2A0
MRAKFTVASITEYANIAGKKIIMSPVLTGSFENEQFYKSTPNGNLEMFINGGSATGYFEIGKEYYLDFTKADS